MKLGNWLTPIFVALLASLWSLGALADDKFVKIGVLTDLSSLYADLGGPGSTSPRKWRSRTAASRKKAGRSTSHPATTRTSRTSGSASHANGSTKTRST